MNIVVFSPTWPKQGDANGIVTYCFNLVSALKSQGHNVYVLAMQVADDAEDFVYSVAYSPSFVEGMWLKLCDYFSPGYSQYYLGAKAIVAGIKNVQKDHVIDIMEIEESFGWHYYIQKKVRFPVTMRLHGPHYVSAKASGEALQAIDDCRFKRELKAFKAALYVNAPSQWILDKVERECEVEWLVTTVFYNPIQPLSLDKCWSPKSYNKHQILFVGRFDALKGGDTVLKAFARVLSEIPEAVLMFVGPDRGISRLDNKSLYINEAIEQFIPEGYWSQVQYLGLLEKEEIETLRQSSHLTVMASKSEVFGYTVLEALASGSPVVASCVGGVAEIIEDDQTGVFFESGSNSDLGEKMLTLLNEDKTSQRIAKSGYERCCKYFSNATIASQAVAFYARVITASKR
jgi:glycosyltransferase involved in cell wall biosynthesis